MGYFSFYATGFTVIAEEKRFSSHIDPAIFDVPKDYQPVESENILDPTLKNGNNYWLKINSSNIEPKYETYDGYLNRIYNIKSNQSTKEFTFKLDLSDQLYLKDSGGGYVLVKDKNTDTDIFLLRTPQGIDSKNRRIDYGYYLTDKTLTLRPKNYSQFDKASYPVKIYAPINSVLWYEALVKVGENCSDPGCRKDGDLLEIRPAGWFWGIEERKQSVIVKVPKLTADNRQRYLARTTKLNDPNDPNLGPDSREEARKAVVSDRDKELIFDKAGLSRFGIDYTALTSFKELALIRDKGKENPILDARDSSNIIAMKSNPLISLIPQDKRLAYKPPSPPGIIKRVLTKIAPPVHAVTTVTKTIGSAGGRDYSTITLWEDGEDGDLVTLDEIHKGEAYKDSDFDEQITIDGSTTDATRYMWLTAASGQQHNGTAGTGVTIKPTTSSANCGSNHCILIISDANTIVEWMEVTENITAGTNLTGFGINYLAGSGGSIVRNNIVHDIDWRQVNRGIMQDISVDCTIINNIIYDIEHQTGGGGRGLQLWNTATTTCSVYNNTVHSNTVHGFNIQGGTGGTQNVKNNIATDNTTADFTFPSNTATLNCSNNLSSDATADDAGCTSAQISKSSADQFVSITGGSENLHLKTGADAIDNGTDLSGTFTNDIDNDTRPNGAAWDIGADEIPENLWSFIFLAPFIKGFLKKIKNKKRTPRMVAG
ncbi:right-handed parallel beta-helix repeat-containing protein [Candidatus Gottesmanbacteria bacterium]|nr:right-handed parallel beta-helix repeat-containing protein [Candidatus Gottesmanbacteria bacterium]